MECSLETVRVLVIEDDPADARAIRQALSRAPERYRVTVCDRLAAALEKLETTPFDAVILDLLLPDTEELDGLTELQRRNGDVPIIVCSGADEQDLALQAVQSGAQDYVFKDRVDDGSLSRCIVYAIERKRSQLFVQNLAYRDSLTGLPNRVLLYDRLSQALAQAQRSGERVAVLYLDLDNFKQVNDTLGHSSGDEVLKAAAATLSRSVRETDTVARLGGDEFVILLPGVRKQSDVTVVARKIVRAFDGGVVVKGRGTNVAPSIGIAICPDDGNDPEQLLKKADAAMYVAKATGGATHQYHSPTLAAAAAHRAHLAEAMERALDQQEFRLYYQPILELATGRMGCAEALIRWKRPEYGLLHPEEFVPVAEKTRMILSIGDWVIDEACHRLRKWRAVGPACPAVAINVSPHQLVGSKIAERILRTLRENRLAPRDLRVEITESALMLNESRALEALGALSDAGVRLSLDDFGTGYASLSLLKELPIDTVKIDRSFVSEVAVGKSPSAKIVEGIIALAHGLGKTVVAEGVETPQQLEFLRERSCDEVQGFLISEPISAEEFAHAFAAEPQESFVPAGLAAGAIR